jgi:hypothetical protein
MNLFIVQSYFYTTRLSVSTMIRLRTPTRSQYLSRESNTSSLDDLPQDVLLNALTFLRFRDVYRFSLSCSRFYELIHHVTDEVDTESTNISQWIWKEMCLNEMRFFDNKIRGENITLTESNKTYKQQLRSGICISTFD